MSRFEFDSNSGNPNFVAALSRGFDILHCFDAQHGSLSHAEIARRVGVPRSTVVRMVATLLALGYLRYNASTERFSLSAGVLELGFSRLAQDGVLSVVLPFMQALANEIDGMVAIGAMRSSRMIYQHVCQGQSPLVLRLEAGIETSLTLSAMGRAYLGALTADELASLIALRPEKADKIQQRAEHSAEQLARQGFCVSLDEWHLGVSGVAVPLRLECGSVLPINCGVSSLRVGHKVLVETIGPKLCAMVARLEAMILPAS